MSTALELLGFSLVPTSAVTLVVGWLVRRFFSAEVASRYALAAPAAAGIVTGYVLLPDWAPLQPERHWQWLPYLALIAGFLGPASVAGGLKWWERTGLQALFALVTAWLVVPTWESLSPPREVWIAILTLLMTGLCLLLTSLPDRLLNSRVLPACALSALLIAAWLAIDTSVKFGQLGLLFFTALASTIPMHRFARKNVLSNPSSSAAAVQGLALLYGVFAVGLAFVGAIEPQPPQLVILALPSLPLLACFSLRWNPTPSA